MTHALAINPFYGIELAYNSIQAYTTQKANHSPHFFTKLNKAKTVFYIADNISLIASYCLVFVKTANGLGMYDPNPIQILFGGSVPALVVGGAYLINKLYKQTLPLSPENIKKFTFSKPAEENVKQVICVVRLILNISLVFFSPLNPLLLLSIGVQLYNLAKLIQRKWVIFEKTIPYRIEHGPNVTSNSTTFKYSFLMTEISSPKVDESENIDNCTICLNKPAEGETMIPFCDNHTLHPDCMVQLLEDNVGKINNHFQVINRRVVGTRYYCVNYTCNLSKSDLPKCPTCRSEPSHGSLAVDIPDLEYPGRSNTIIHWLP